MARNARSPRSRNNNPEGRNQYSGGFADYARERPMTAAAVTAAAVGAGVFLWSRRSQISDQLSNLSDQISEWSEGMRSTSSSETELETAGSEQQSFMARPSRRGAKKSQSEIAEEALTLKETGTTDPNTRV